MTHPVSRTLLSVSDQLTCGLVVGEDDELPFCVRDNVTECLAYLNQEFVLVGLPPICRDDNCVDSCHKTSLIDVINASYSLLQRFRRCAKSRDELQESKHRAESDLDRAQQDRKKLSVQLDQIQRDLLQAQLREKQITTASKIVTDKLKNEKDEVRRLQLVMQNRDAQYKHAIRKKESELIRLKERLHSLLNDSKTEARIGCLEMSEKLSRADGKRGRWKISGNNLEDEMYRVVISAHEEKNKQLIVENHELCQILTYLLAELTTLTDHSCSQQGSARQSEDTEVDVTKASSTEANANDTFTVDSSSTNTCDERISHLTDGQLNLPFSVIEVDIRTELRQKMTHLKNYVHKLETMAAVLSSDTQDDNDNDNDDVQQHLKLLHLDPPQLCNNNEMTSSSLQVPSSELVEDHQWLKAFYTELAEFEERKLRLAELECQLNKRLIATEMDRCDVRAGSRLTCGQSLHRPRSAVSQSEVPAARHRLLQGAPSPVRNGWLVDKLVSNRNGDGLLSSSSFRSMSCDRSQTDSQQHFHTSLSRPHSVDNKCHSNALSVTSSLDLGGSPLTSSLDMGNPGNADVTSLLPGSSLTTSSLDAGNTGVTSFLLGNYPPTSSVSVWNASVTSSLCGDSQMMSSLPGNSVANPTDSSQLVDH